jgi:hypothetical protein
VVLTGVALQIRVEIIISTVERGAVVGARERRFLPDQLRHSRVNRLRGSLQPLGRGWRIFQEVEDTQGVAFG